MSSDSHLRLVAAAGSPASGTSQARRARPKKESPPLEFAYVLIPPGEYRVAFSGQHRATMWGKPRWSIALTVVTEGDHHGVVLPMFLRVPTGNPRPSWSLTAAFVAATGERPPKRLAQMQPSKYLAECVLLAAVETVDRDAHGREHPPAMHYSKVSRLIRRLGGCPPCIRNRGPS